MAGGAKTTAGPSVMGPAGQQDGSLPGGPTQTAAGRPPRTEPRGAREELDLRTMLAVKEDVRERMAAAMALVDGVVLLAEEAVLECEQGRKPVIALASRFVRRGGEARRRRGVRLGIQIWPSGSKDKEQLSDAKRFASAARDSLLDVRGVAGPPARGGGLRSFPGGATPANCCQRRPQGDTATI